MDGTEGDVLTNSKEKRKVVKEKVVSGHPGRMRGIGAGTPERLDERMIRIVVVIGVVICIVICILSGIVAMVVTLGGFVPERQFEIDGDGRPTPRCRDWHVPDQRVRSDQWTQDCR